MARTIQILSITPSGTPGNPGRIAVSDDLTAVFQGKFYRNEAGATQPFHSSATTPVGYSLVSATQFDIVDNPTYNGRYTVYTPVSSTEQSSTFEGGITTIRVAEVVLAPSVENEGDDENTGKITNISTYMIEVNGGDTIIVSPTVNLTNRPIELFGRNTPAWGEGYAQNFVSLAQNFAGATAPANPYRGQQWYDTSATMLKTWSGSSWVISNANAFGITYKHTQTTAATTWTVTHNQNLPEPFIAFVQVFKDIGGGVAKMILPQDITFVNATTLTITFSNPEKGWVLVRP